MANKGKSSYRPGPNRDQRRVRAQQLVFVIISLVIILTMVAMLMSKF